MRLLHVVVTANFAGVERYVATVAAECADRGHEVVVVGGSPTAMPAACGPAVTWVPGASPREALAAARRLGRFDVCHAHMTHAELVALLSRRGHRAPVISTRHFAGRRGSTLAGRAASGWIGRRLAAEIAISQFTASRMEHPPTLVLANGVAEQPIRWRPENRVVLVMQRLEPEKDTETALMAWQASGLAQEGWRLRIVGDGAERPRLQEWVRAQAVTGVEFVGWVAGTGAELSHAGILMAPAPAEPFGLAVVEAMAAGVPPLAAAGGAHLETVGLADVSLLFQPRNTTSAAARLRELATDQERRSRISERVRAVQRQAFNVSDHVTRLLGIYATPTIELNAASGSALQGARTWP